MAIGTRSSCIQRHCARLVLGAALILSAAVLPSTPASAKMGLNQNYKFNVVWSLFPELILAKGALSLKRTATIYSLGLVMSAKLMAPAIDWRGRFVVEGEQTGPELNPKRFLRESIRPSVQETVIVDWTYEPDKMPETVIMRQPSTVLVERDPVDPEDVRDVIDPLSFLAQLLLTVEETNGDSCEMTAKTWDGVRLATVRTETVEKVQAARIDCRVYYDKIDGLRADTPWQVREENTLRIVRFRNEEGIWRPKWLKIEGEFGGFRSTFTTNIEPDES